MIQAMRSLLRITNQLFSSQSEQEIYEAIPVWDASLVNHPQVSRRLLRRMYQASIPQGGWEEFKDFVKEIQPSFFKKLREAIPGLKEEELQLCTLIYLGRSTREMVKILRFQPAYIRFIRTRLRSRLRISDRYSFYQGLQMLLADAIMPHHQQLAA